MSFKLLARYKASSRKGKAAPRGRQRELLGVFLAVAGSVSFYSVLFPSGEWGSSIKAGLAWTFGAGRFLVPLWVAYFGLRLAWPKPWPFAFLRAVCGLAFFFFFSVFCTLFGQAVYRLNYGGAVGLQGEDFFHRLFGAPGSWAVSLVGGLLSLCGILNLTPIQAIQWVHERLQADMEEWRKAREEKTAKRPPVVKPRPLAAAPAAADAKPLIAKREEALPPIPLQEAKPSKPVIVEPVREKLPPPPPPEKPAAATTPAPALPAANGNGGAKAPAQPWRLPPVSLLADARKDGGKPSEDELVGKARLLEATLANFGVQARATDIHPGPVITRFDLEPAPGVKISSIVNLSDDIALAMKATRVRVLAPIPGKGAVGIEIPNSQAATVTLKEIMSDARFQSSRSPLTIALGKTSSGEPYVSDIGPMPHLLVAGATGTGKSVCIHTLLMSVIMKSTPDQVKFLLIDPKRLEMPAYEGLPHLYDPRNPPENAQVITNPKDAAKALSRMVQVMEYRYELFAKYNVRNIDGFNEKRVKMGEEPVSYIVIIIDELADLMLVSAKEVEDCIQRLAQMARAVGIHLVLATQRPSVDVITGVIKANLPARIALRVASQTDSRVILDTIGAESLVGRGDMLFLPAGAPAPIRLQGAFVSEQEVSDVVAYWKEQGGPRYEDVFAAIAAAQATSEDDETRKELDEGLRLVMERKRVSQDLLKAHFGSSARATNVLSLMEIKGFIHKPEGTNKWEIDVEKIQDYWRAGAKSAQAAAQAAQQQAAGGEA
jgi:S-DNA-T family DNA segregation ATPase FtsK/SpoIIIE